MLKISLLNINTHTENKIALGSMLPVMTIDSPKANKKIIKPAYSGFVFRKICNFSKDTIWFQKIFLLLHDCLSNHTISALLLFLSVLQEIIYPFETVLK